jgi:[ribosomal protein S5]-alanine N-acetyltransferase
MMPSGRRLTLRGLGRGDRVAWEAVRARNDTRLARWEATLPGTAPSRRTSFGRMRRGFDRAAQDGTVLPFVIDVDGRLVGQMHLFDVLWGSRRSGCAGYWLDQQATGHGLATWALAALTDHALLEVGLHRVEVAIRTENLASLAVASRLRLPEEGVARGLMHVEGGWRDHRIFAVVAEDLGPGGYAAGGLIPWLRRAAPPDT